MILCFSLLPKFRANCAHEQNNDYEKKMRVVVKEAKKRCRRGGVYAGSKSREFGDPDQTPLKWAEYDRLIRPRWGKYLLTFFLHTEEG